MSGRGSWSEMGKKRWDEDTVIAAIKALAAKNGCAKCTDDGALYAAARIYFKSWSRACAVAGVPAGSKEKSRGYVMSSCLMYDKETKSCKGLNELVCARKECSFCKRANAENRRQYAKDMAMIEKMKRDKYFKGVWM